MATIGKIQLGKQGLTDNFLKTLRDHFKKNKVVKISVLQSHCRDKKELKEISRKILDFLGGTFTCKCIGYTITIKKWRKAKE